MTSKTAMIQELNNIEARIHQKLRLEFEELFVDELTDKQHIVLKRGKFSYSNCPAIRHHSKCSESIVKHA
ncbi:hypothetical protein P9186_12190 [Bacillus safensis]|uniref:hypothetical protein n=1 Tax=Bacillus safensis TaxID=561879 RepID=UPI0022828C62|nr:hypothetical protein [Bacillus safensis]MCY7566511.1 hypothetical protein [Bacillus safensis]MCY7649582.1 hypothetical protein [Bacillus safensis]MEC3672635.1 hypothetical protein [Bacillus safensis]MEC3682904.1 hypothetical protein [Bacillus safensis]